MADNTERDAIQRQHLEWLMEGIESWNARRLREKFTPDFAGANLNGANLNRVDLDGANLAEANLVGTNLGAAELEGANLRGANLERAILREANLTEASLTGANLRWADLGGAYLLKANFTKSNLLRTILREANLSRSIFGDADLGGANLEGANLGGADFGRANLGGADLGKARLLRSNLEGADLLRANLAGANLGGANLRGANLLRTSLSEANLMGANVKSAMVDIKGNKTDSTDISSCIGLTQAQLDSMEGDTETVIPDNLSRPSHWPDLDHPEIPAPETIAPSPPDPFIFLSHADNESARIKTLCQFLLQDTSIPVWWDQDIPTDTPWWRRIGNWLDSANAVLVLWTAESVQSKGAIEQASRAQNDGKLVHVRLDDAPLPNGFGETQSVDLSGWDGTATYPAMRKLVQALRDKLDPPTDEALIARLNRTSPIAMAADDGKLSPLDTPPHAPPVTENPVDLDARLAGLRQSIDILKEKAQGRFQLPDDLHHCLDGIGSALNAEPLTWYGLEDTRDSLGHCMTVHDASQAWNDVIVADLLRVIGRIAELQPLLQPRQVPPDQPDAKPPETDPVIKPPQVPEVVDLAEQVEQELETAEAEASLSDGAKALLHNQTNAIKDASQELNDEKRLPRLRAALMRLAYLTKSIVAAADTSSMRTRLAAPDSLKILAGRLKLIFDALLKFFQ